MILSLLYRTMALHVIFLNCTSNDRHYFLQILEKKILDLGKNQEVHYHILHFQLPYNILMWVICQHLRNFIIKKLHMNLLLSIIVINLLIYCYKLFVIIHLFHKGGLKGEAIILQYASDNYFPSFLIHLTRIDFSCNVFFS